MAALSRFCPIAAIASWAWVLARPKYRARCSPKRPNYRKLYPKGDSSYQPSKAEMEEEFDMPGADMETLRRAFFKPRKPPKSGTRFGQVSAVGG